MFVDDVLRVGQLSFGVAGTAAHDIPGLLQFPHRLTDGVHALPADAGQPLKRIVPFFGQREHHRKKALCFQGQTPVLEVMVGHDGIILCFFDPEHRHGFFLRFFWA